MSSISKQRMLLAVLLPILLAGSRGRAATLRVERDGSGHFTAIQDAVDVSAVGDTILIGPGRYTEFAPFTNSGWTEDTYVAVTQDSLTLVGTDRDGVVIGPEVPEFQGFSPKGIATHTDVTFLRVQQLTLENLRDGIWGVGRVEVEQCLIRGCDTGIVAVTAGGLLVRNCDFLQNLFLGIATFQGAQSIEVEACVFEGNALAVAFTQSLNARVMDCVFRGNTVGVQHAEGSTGVVQRCRFEDSTNSGAVLVDNVQIPYLDCVFTGGGSGIRVKTFSELSGTRCVLSGGTYAALNFTGTSTADFHGNDITIASGHLVRAEGYVIAPTDIDLTSNYWGTDSADSIASWILDGNDPVPIGQTNLSNVIFEPFSPVPLPAKKASVGGLKARFGGRR